VILLSDPACKVSARIGRTGSFGLVQGLGVNAQGYPVARMRFIHKDAPVHTGDAVVTSGLGGVFPKNILIGYVERVSTEEGGLYQVADIIPKAVAELADVVFVAGGEKDAEAEE
jgi:rod shape-determining protein MreC